MSYVIQIKHPDSDEWQDYEAVGESFKEACKHLARVEKYVPHIDITDLYMQTLGVEPPPKARLQIAWRGGDGKQY